MRPRRSILVLVAAVWCAGLSSGFSEDADHGSFYCLDGPPGSAMSRAVYVVNYLYARGPSPQPIAFAGNADCKGGVDLIDVVYLVNYAFRGGPAPCDWCGWYVDLTDTRDAEEIAMWLAREVTAPEPLLDRIQGDLVRLRTAPGADQTALASIPFFPDWIESRISMSVDSLVYDSMQAGLYHAWDEFNATFGAIGIDFEHYYPGSSFFVFVHFAGIKNSVVLAELYATLPGVHGSWASHRIYLGGNPPQNMIYPLIRDDTITYLFRMSWDFKGIWGRNRFWYAATLPDTAWIAGDWDHKVNPETPSWWPQAQENLERYWED